jgi:ABC-type phosphate transport system substrate-binding protein
MDTLVQKRFSGSLALLVVGLSVLCCMVFADSGVAAVPPEGLNCVSSDGKISGRGATFQEKVQSVFANTYRDDYCGNVAEQFAGDPAGNTMVAYDYPAAAAAKATGSGAGLKAASCRTDAYSGSDIPYTNANLKGLNEAPGTLGECGIAFEPPFQPHPKPWPNASDTTAPIMSFPVTGSSVTPAVNLTTTTCGGKPPPAAINLTPKALSRLFGGDIAAWNDEELVKIPGNAEVGKELANCTAKVIRIVRFDSSGTTNILKQYLIRAEEERTGQKCAAGKKWSAYFTTNTEWPGKQSPSTEGTCSEIKAPGSSGGKEVIALVKATEGAVGYSDLADSAEKGLLLPSVESALKTGSFQPPNTGKSANCTYTSLSLPGASQSDAVGLNPEDQWANNNEENLGSTGNHENATDVGSKYPICGITFDLVYTGLDNGKVANADSRLTADQRRTMYAYFTFIESSAAQDLLGSNNYAPLPSAWLPKLRGGFQENF